MALQKSANFSSTMVLVGLVEVYRDFGTYISTTIIRLLQLEMKAVADDPLMKHSVSDLTPEYCELLNFQAYEKIFLEKAPVGFVFIQAMSCVERTMPKTRHISTKEYEVLEDEDYRGPAEQKLKNKAFISVMAYSIMHRSRSQ